MNNLFILNSIADGSFRCIPCGNLVYSTSHLCKEQLNEMAKEAERLMDNPKLNENS